MPRPMGNTRRGPDDLDLALDNLLDDRDDENLEDGARSASPAGSGGPVLGEGEEVGPWTEEEKGKEMGDDALEADSGASDEDDDGGGYQTPPRR
jgi:hypothetical protein